MERRPSPSRVVVAVVFGLVVIGLVVLALFFGDEPEPQQTAAPGSGQVSANCETPPPAGEPFVGGPTAQIVDLGEINGARVRGVVYPRPDYQGDPWTQWGQGLVLADGTFLSAIGDHLGPDGNSYIYRYDPATGELATVGDILSYIDHQPGSWGYGKVHGHIVAGPCGEAYFSTYWGTYRGLEFSGSYTGDVLFRVDTNTETITNLDVPIELHGSASIAGWADGGLLYGEAVDPFSKLDDSDQGPFFVYDVVAEEILFEGPPLPHVGFRNVLVGDDGKAYYSVGDGQLSVYDPVTGDLGTHSQRLPGDWLRASTIATESGLVVGVTREPDTFFVMDPSGDITQIGEPPSYTASIAVHPDGDRFFYMPGAHGNAAQFGGRLTSVDIGSGDETVIAELSDLVAEELGVVLGGTYNVAVDPGGQLVYIGANAGLVGGEDAWGEVVLLEITLP